MSKSTFPDRKCQECGTSESLLLMSSKRAFLLCRATISEEWFNQCRDRCLKLALLSESGVPPQSFGEFVKSFDAPSL